MAQKFTYVDENQQYVPSKEAYYTTEEGLHRGVLSAFYTVNGVHRQVFQHEHRYEGEDISEPSCESAGETKYTCPACGHVYSEYPEALGHDYEVTGESEATCTEDGYTEYTCSRCGDSYQNVTDPALGHDWNNESGECSRCPASHIHQYEGITDKGDPTCEKPGYEISICTECGYENYNETDPALGHDWVHKDNEDGTHRIECSRCGAIQVDSQKHDWGDPVPNGDGTHTYTCNLCTATETYNCEYVWKPYYYNPESSFTLFHASTCKHCGHVQEGTIDNCTFTDVAEGEHICSTCGNSHELVPDTNIDEYLCDTCRQSYQP